LYFVFWFQSVKIKIILIRSTKIKKYLIGKKEKTKKNRCKAGYIIVNTENRKNTKIIIFTPKCVFHLPSYPLPVFTDVVSIR